MVSFQRHKGCPQSVALEGLIIKIHLSINDPRGGFPSKVEGRANVMMTSRLEIKQETKNDILTREMLEFYVNLSFLRSLF